MGTSYCAVRSTNSADSTSVHTACVRYQAVEDQGCFSPLPGCWISERTVEIEFRRTDSLEVPGVGALRAD
jgi:hypothetical protein